MNTGLHDGVRISGHANVYRAFADLLQGPVADWLTKLLGWSAPARGSDARFARCRPRRVWKHNTAPAGASRGKPANAQKLEAFNRLVVAVLLNETATGGARGDHGASARARARAAPRGAAAGCARPLHGASDAWSFLDSFDMSFPFHFDHAFSDGGHYGRFSPDGVTEMLDRMVIQALLNTLCSR